MSSLLPCCLFEKIEKTESKVSCCCPKEFQTGKNFPLAAPTGTLTAANCLAGISSLSLYIAYFYDDNFALSRREVKGRPHGHVRTFLGRESLKYVFSRCILATFSWLFVESVSQLVGYIIILDSSAFSLTFTFVRDSCVACQPSSTVCLSFCNRLVA